MTKIYSVVCPSCEAETPLSTKNKEALKEMKIECPNCKWKGLANQGIIQEKTFEEWF